MAGDTDGSVQKRYLTACLQALQNAKTDTEKFAALLMVAKVVKAQDCTANDKKQILNAVGFAFLIRLFRTKEVPEGCSSLIFKSVAVNVLSAVLEDPSMASDKQMSQIAPYLKEILESAHIKKHEEEKELLCEMARDTISIVSKMACTPGGGQMLMDLEYPSVCVQILHSKPEEETFVMIQTLLILLHCHFGSEVWTRTEGLFEQYLTILGRCISDCEDKSLFNICELTTHILSYAPEKRRKETCAVAVQLILKKLSSVIRSKLGVPQRQTVVALVNQLVVCFGVECLLPPAFPDHKAFLLALSLTCVEIRMAVENVTEDQVRKSASRLCLHYNTLETMLNFLCEHDESHDLPLAADMFCKAHDALLTAAQGIFYFLQQIDSGYLAIPLQDPLTVASVRMVAAISSQAFTEVKENIMNVLPFLVKLCQTEVGPAPTSTAEVKVTDTDRRENEGGAAAVNRTAGGVTEPHITNPGASSAVPERRSCSCVSDRLAGLQIQPGGAAQSTDSPPSTGKADTESCASKDKHETCSCQQMINACCGSEDCVAEDMGSSAETGNSVVDECVGEGRKLPSSGFQSCDSKREEEGQGGKRGKRSTSARADLVSREVMLPTTLEELTVWICSMVDSSCVQLPSLDVIKFLLPVFQEACEEEETKHVFVELCGHTVLADFLLKRLPVLRTLHGSFCEREQMTDCQALELLSQLVTEEEGLGQADPFTRLLNTALTTVPQLDEIPELYVYKAHWTAAGLSLLRVRASQHETCEKERVSLFFQSAVRYVCQAPVCTAGYEETGAKRWHDVQDVWMMALQNLTALIPCFPELTELFLQHKFSQTAANVLQTSPGSVIKADSVPIVEKLVKTLAQRDH
ncbi:uncharacterized protein LOC143298770 [Babylonia areolata]|uniref:uncharacterized protein LOC143298770 n=1 Tax=Babylonia areolata TaxID=304850 RepID=UPI003FCF4303